jgi:hypothetical protein
MKDLAKRGGGKIMLLVALAAVMAMALASSASAALTVDAKDFTEPVESQIETALPIVVGFVAALFVVGFIIRWIQKRAKSAG